MNKVKNLSEYPQKYLLGGDMEKRSYFYLRLGTNPKFYGVKEFVLAICFETVATVFTAFVNQFICSMLRW